MIGKTISHYKILEKIGGGGMGVVFKAEDTKLKRQVALKFLKRDFGADSNAGKRFFQEARAASALDHGNICTIHEIDETTDGQIFIVMALCEGVPLKDRIKQGPLPENEALGIAAQTAEGLREAHEHGISHRDIKPGNIIVSEKGMVKIVDFGLARLAGAARITESGITVGTVEYMSPEQAGGGEVDLRTDLWSLGVVFYEMLTSRLPFSGENIAAIAYAIVNSDYTPVSELRSEVSPGLDAVVGKCLEKDPEKRYQTAAGLLRDLSRLRTGATTYELPVADAAVRPAAPKAVKPPAFRVSKLVKRVTTAAAALAIILAAIFAVSAVWQAIEGWLLRAEIPHEKYLAVLPFTNIGQNPENQPFCDGLMEILSSKISAMEQFQDSLWVVPAREVVEGGINSPSRARTAYGASLVITGSLDRQDSQVRLTLNLVDTGAMRQLRSIVFDTRISDVRTLQDETVLKLAEMLEVELNPGERETVLAGGTDVPDAYQYYIQGRGFLQQYQVPGNVEKAIGLFELALKEDPRYALAHAGLGEAYYRKYVDTNAVSWAGKAMESCRQAAAINDKLAPVRNTVGLAYIAVGRYENAISEFNNALKLDPVNADALRGLARAYSLMGKPKEAEAAYKQAIQLRPDYWGGYHLLGAFYLRSGRYAEAEKQYKKVLELTPENTTGLINLGVTYLQMGRFDDAAEMFERSIEISPDDFALNNLAVIYARQSRYAEAARLMEKAMEWADQSDYLAWGNLADCYYLVPEEREKAKTFYRKAIKLAEEHRKLNPQNQGVIVNLASYYQKVGDKATAQQLLAQLPEKIEDLENLLRALETYEALGMREKALVMAAEALARGLPADRFGENPFLKDFTADERYQRLASK